jgi:hypothetical protein
MTIIPEPIIPVTRLNDDQVRQVFADVPVREASKPEGEQNHFLIALAGAVQFATRRDFMILRPYVLIVIAKYNLGVLLRDKPADVVVHK